MKMRSQLSALAMSLFLVSLASSALVAQPTPTDEQVRMAAKKGRTGRTGGMTLKEAQKVVVDCINKASGFMAISNTRKVPLNRLEDTLEDLGITDTTRLNTLRRYLVRNEEIGVQSVSREIGGKKWDDTPLRFYRFMVTSHDLLAINRSQKLSEVIQLIAKIAGYSEMPIGTAYQILADCKSYARDGQLANSAGTDADTKKIKVTDVINTKLTSSPAEFAKCVADSPIFGVPSVDFDSAHGDALQYFIKIIRHDAANDGDCKGLSAEACAIKDAVDDGLTFECVAKLMTKTSFVSLPKEALAGELVMTALRGNLKKKDPDKPDSEFVSFDKNSTLGEILYGGTAGLSRLITELKANVCPQSIDLDCVQGKNKNKVVTRRGVVTASSTVPADCNILGSITGSTTVDTLVKEVEKSL